MTKVLKLLVFNIKRRNRILTKIIIYSVQCTAYSIAGVTFEICDELAAPHYITLQIQCIYACMGVTQNQFSRGKLTQAK